MIGRWTTRVVVAAAVLTLLAAACGSSSSPSSGSSSGGTTSSTSAATTGTTSGSGGGTTTTSGGGSKSTDTISQVNYAFNPSKPSVKSGSTVSVKNTTTDTPHTFTVTGQNIDVTVQPGTTAKVKVNLPPGTYPFVCTFHESLGMTGTLTVT